MSSTFCPDCVDPWVGVSTLPSPSGEASCSNLDLRAGGSNRPAAVLTLSFPSWSRMTIPRSISGSTNMSWVDCPVSRMLSTSLAINTAPSKAAIAWSICSGVACVSWLTRSRISLISLLERICKSG